VRQHIVCLKLLVQDGAMRFYRPFTMYSKKFPPRIVYPARDEGRLDLVFDRTRPGALEAHIDSLYAERKELKAGAYHILVVWALKGKPMLDVWVMSMTNYYSLSGPFVTCKTFTGTKPSHDTGLASGDGLIVLGYEEELRRALDRKITFYTNRQKYLPNIPATVLTLEPFTTQ